MRLQRTVYRFQWWPPVRVGAGRYFESWSRGSYYSASGRRHLVNSKINTGGTIYTHNKWEYSHSHYYTTSVAE